MIFEYKRIAAAVVAAMMMATGAVSTGAERQKAATERDSGSSAEFTGKITYEYASSTDSVTVSTEALADRLIDDAKALLGTPYRYGSPGPRSFDCSGFTGYIYRKYGYDLERSSGGQARQGREVSGPWSNLQKGDIVVFAARRNTSRVGHVGIFIELSADGKDFTFIHAAVKGGVIVSHITEKYYSTRFLGARRILPDFVKSPVDSLAAPLPENAVLDTRDTLSLGDGDRRVLLLEDGRWMLIQGDGSLKAPEDSANIVLYSSGKWSRVENSSHRIPTGKTHTAAAAVTENTEKETSSEREYHTIKSGDTLSSIAARYGTSIDAVCRLNGISRNTVLRIGRRLRVK